MTLEEKLKKYIKASDESHNKREFIKAEYYINNAYNIAINYSITHNKYLFAQILNNKAIFKLLRKSFKEAEKYFKKAIKIKKSGCIVKHDSLATSLNGLAQVYKFLGDFTNSSNCFKEATLLAISNRSKYLSPHYCDLARIQKITYNIDEAIKTYQKSIAAAIAINAKTKKEHKFYEQILYYCYNDLSEIELTKGKLQLAKQYHQQSLKVLEKSKSDISNFFEAYKRFEIPAKMLVHQKQYEKAINLFKKAKFAIIEEYLGFEVGKDLANIIHQIGTCYTSLNQHQKALQTYQTAIESVCNNFQNQRIEDLPNIKQIYNKRSAIASLSYKATTWLQLYEEQQNQSHLKQAYQTYQLIAALLPITRRDYVEENSKFQLADETKGIYEKAIETCLLLHQLSSDKKYVDEAFQFVESSKAIVLQEKLQANFALQGMEENVQQQDIDFRSKIAFYQSSINTNKATKGDSEQLKNWESELWNCKEAYERFQQKIEEENPNYYQVKYAQSLTSIKALQERLTPESALIEYFTGADNLYIFVISKGTYVVHQTNMCSKQQLEDIQLFKKFIHQFNITDKVIEDYERFKNLAYQLYQKLLAPALKDLNQSIQRLIIIPDGLLYHITFEALLTSEKCHHPSAFYHTKNLDYVFKKYALSYCYSASMLANTYHKTNFTYEQIFSGFAPSVKDLHRNQAEVIQINTLLQGEVLLNERATLENFRQKAIESQIVHLSTHAKCNNEEAKLSCILFHNKQTLDISTIENMKTNAGLIVLSACETGYGSIQNGEGAMSLARSFFLSGCPSLLASLWLANDQSTTKLMLYFYQYIKSGLKKDVALQQAKLQYGAESGLRDSHPFYWAGFVQYGNRRALF